MPKSKSSKLAIPELRKELLRRIKFCDKLQFEAFKAGEKVPNINIKKLAYQNILAMIS